MKPCPKCKTRFRYQYSGDRWSIYCRECHSEESKSRYRKKNAEKILARSKIIPMTPDEKRIHLNKVRHAWAEKNREKMRGFQKKSKEKHRGKVIAYGVRYRASHREYYRAYNQSKHGKFITYKRSALVRKISFSLSENQFLEFWQKDCHYCGDKIKTVGVDRVNSRLGYSIGNIVPACEHCNIAKLDRPKHEFILMCHRVAERHPL